MDLCYQTTERCVVAVALWLVMSAIDCEAVANGVVPHVLLAGCCAAGLVGWVCVCVSGEDRE